MARVTLQISNGFYVSESLPISNQRCVNFYPNIPQAPSSTQDNLFPTPGLVNIANASSEATPNVGKICRGGIALEGQPYLVYGNSLWRVDFSSGPPESFTAVQIPGTIDGIDRCIFAQNGSQIVIVAPPDDDTSGRSYCYDKPTDTLAEITDVNFDGPASFVAYIDGFFVFAKADGKKYFHSPLNDGRGLPSGAAYDPLDFGVANADPDPIQAIAEHQNQGYIFGTQTTEIVRNIGRSPSTFQRIQGAVIDVGVQAPYSIIEYAGELCFIGGAKNDSPSVWMLSGGSKRRISTTAIDNELSKLTSAELAQVYSWVYSESGAFFYGFVTPNTCFVHDLVNNRWHERQSLVKTTLGRYRVAVMIDAYARIIVGDNQDTIIGQLQEDVYLEYGQIVQRFVTSQPFENQGIRTSVGEIEAVIENGVGLPNDVTVSGGTSETGFTSMVTGGSDPQITLAWSDNGGRTFEGFISRSMGRMGNYIHRPIWDRLGDFPRARVLRFEVTSPTDAVILKVEAEIE